MKVLTTSELSVEVGILVRPAHLLTNSPCSSCRF